MLGQWDIKECFRHVGSDEYKWRLRVRRITMEAAVSLRQVEQQVPKPKMAMVLQGMRENAIQIGDEQWVPDHFVMLFLLLEVEGKGITELQRAVTTARTRALQEMRASCEDNRRHAQELLQEVEDRLAQAVRRPGTGKRRR